MRRVRGIVAPLLAAAAFLAAADARAFCRTTTTKSPPDYNAVGVGCWAAGVPLFWRNTCVGYSIQEDASRKVTYEQASNALSIAFTRWTAAACPTDGSGRSRTSIDVRDLGPVSCGKVEYVSGVANQNVIVFRDETWKYGPSVLGLTTVVYNPQTGEIYNADMEINTLDMDPLAVEDPVAPDAYDFLSVVTHEAGHFLGIAHSDVPGSTMFARYLPGQTDMRNLAQDDVLAICTVYTPDGFRAVLDGKVTAAPQCNPTPRGGYNEACQDPPTACGSIAPGRANETLAPVAIVAGATVLAVAARRRLSSRRRSSSR